MIKVKFASQAGPAAAKASTFALSLNGLVLDVASREAADFVGECSANRNEDGTHRSLARAFYGSPSQRHGSSNCTPRSYRS
jgi:hypothetical protein